MIGPANGRRIMPNRRRVSASALIEMVYAAALHPDRWEVFLDRLAEALRGSASLLHYDTEGHTGAVAAVARVTPETQKLYVDYYHGLDPWGGSPRMRERLRAGDCYLGQELVDERQYQRSEYLNDFAVPNGVAHIAGVTVAVRGGSTASHLTLHRPATAALFGLHELRTLRLLAPHLVRAMQVHARLSQLESRVTIHADALDRLPTGVFLLDSDGRVLFANRAANRVLTARDGLTLDGGHLRAASSDGTRTLRDLITSGLAPGRTALAASGGACRVSRPSGLRDLVLLVCPVRSSEGLPGSRDDTAAIVFVTDPETPRRIDVDALRRWFGLTPSEARMWT
jgi:PAS domain-containing protein